jgi:predicted ATPase
MADNEAVGSVSTVPEQSRLKLQTNYAQAVLWSKGFAAEETRAAFERTGDLATRAEFPAERFLALFGQFLWSLLHGDIRSARQIAEGFLQEAEAQGRLAEAGVGHRLVGLTSMFLGDLVEACRHLEVALSTYDRERDSEVRERFALDTGVTARVYLALASWLGGDLQRASQLIEEAMALGGDLGHLPDVIHALWYKVYIRCLRNDPESVAVDAENLLRTSLQHGVELFAMLADVALSWARGRLGDARSGANELRRSLAEYTTKGNRLFVPAVLALLAELESASGDDEHAQSAIDEGLAVAQEGGQHYADSFLHRLHGDLLLKLNPDDPEPAAAAYKTAVDVSEHQGMRTYRLLASLSLSKLYQSTGRLVEAHTVLEPALVGFSPTPEMPEIAEARALLAKLAETDEVKSAEGQRERRLRLQTAYGQAMMWSKGYNAEETKAAFARAAELAGRTRDFSGRLTALHGQWAAVLVGGELSSARNLAFALLREMESERRAWETGIANRMIGLTAYSHGDFVEARTHCERALEAPDTKPDPNVAQGFSADSIVSSAYLAPTLWVLGYVERARELINTATRRAGVIDVPAMADALHWKVDLEILRDDPAATLSAAESLEVVAQENDMAQWLNVAQLAAAWARGRINEPAGGAAQFRQALTRLDDLGVRTTVGLSGGLLAELEVETLGAKCGLARIDDALRLATQTETRFALSFLHRIRGKILLRLNPADLASAEEAFRIAIAIAREQGSRSFGLRAALSLAKLYQSTGRPADAPAVLTPALEGFSPTSEMPEIAEAQALLVAIEAGAHVRHE